jgi:hypothetical protein
MWRDSCGHGKFLSKEENNERTIEQDFSKLAAGGPHETSSHCRQLTLRQ